MGALADFALLAALFATAFAMGAVVIQKLVPRGGRLGGLFALAVGFWIVAVGVLVLGLVSVAAVPWVFVGALCWGLRAPRELVRDALSSRKDDREPLDGWSKLMLVLILLAAVLTLPGVLAPPYEYDELEYHLGGLADYRQAGHIVFLPHNFFTNMPQLTEMLYLLALTASSDTAAKLLHWAFGLLSAFGIYTIAARLWTRRIGCMAAALFYCVPYLQDLSQTARIDLATTFFATLAFGGLLLWTEHSAGRPDKEIGAPTDNGWLWLSALLTGCAIATKWTAVALVLLPAVLCILVVRRSVRLSAVFCLLASLCVLPWLLKTWWFTGNPVYPMLDRLFHNPHWSPAQTVLLGHYGSLGVARWSEFGELIWRYSFSETSATPLLLMTAPLILLLRNAAPSARRTGWLFVGAYAGWFFLTHRPWRFLFPALPLAAMAGAYAFPPLARDGLARIIARFAVVAVAGLGILWESAVTLVDQENYRRVPPRMDFLQYSLGQVSRDEFIARMGEACSSRSSG